MDFFREQDIARRNSRLLTLLFALAVLTLIALTTAVLGGVTVVGGASTYQPISIAEWLRVLDWPLFFSVAAAISLVVGTVVLFNWLRFSQGGDAVAEALGGRPVTSGSSDPLERQAQNVVEEIALAANMPVPPLYILDDERGINAFAAGTSVQNAVVAVTRGSLEQLNRQELQGVIGHEFSHILNGDMRLSIRLAALLRGITFIGDVGGVLLRSVMLGRHRRRRTSDNGKNDATVLVLFAGVSLYVIGLLGGLLAGFIKSAISRQKEYLADASSVQFTRDPNAIASALKVIGGFKGGTLVHSARAEELSHLFFGQVKHSLWNLFATHPPLEQRIQRLEPGWDGEFIERSAQTTSRDARSAARAASKGQLGEALSAVVTVAAVENMAAVQNANLAQGRAPTASQVTSSTTLSPSLRLQTHEPFDAMACVLALLWQDDRPGAEPATDKQRDILNTSGVPGLTDRVVNAHSEIAALSSHQRLELLFRSLPAIKTLSKPQRDNLNRLMLLMIRADGEIALFEWCLFQLSRHHLEADSGKNRFKAPRYASLKSVKGALATAMGTLATLGDRDTGEAFDAGTSALGLELTLPEQSALSVADFSRAMDTLADCFPLIKPKILKAMAKIAAHDKHVSGAELTLIKAIAVVIDCPVPDALLNSIISETPDH